MVRFWCLWPLTMLWLGGRTDVALDGVAAPAQVEGDAADAVPVGQQAVHQGASTEVKRQPSTSQRQDRLSTSPSG